MSRKCGCIIEVETYIYNEKLVVLQGYIICTS